MAEKKTGEVMSAAELKPLLRLARRRPVSCAIALTKDRHAVILLNRRIKPRKLMSELRHQAEAAGLKLETTLIRFGRATVNGASDSQKVVLTVNKPAPGAMTIPMLAQLRPAGFQRCEIVVDEGIETEPEDGEDEDDEDDREEPENPTQEASALRRDLIGLVREIAPAIAQEPELKPTLLDLAKAGRDKLAHGDLPAAATSIARLDTALHHAPKPGAEKG